MNDDDATARQSALDAGVRLLSRVPASDRAGAWRDLQTCLSPTHDERVRLLESVTAAVREERGLQRLASALDVQLVG